MFCCTAEVSPEFSCGTHQICFLTPAPLPSSHCAQPRAHSQPVVRFKPSFPRGRTHPAMHRVSYIYPRGLLSVAQTTRADIPQFYFNATQLPVLRLQWHAGVLLAAPLRSWRQGAMNSQTLTPRALVDPTLLKPSLYCFSLCLVHVLKANSFEKLQKRS